MEDDQPLRLLQEEWDLTRDSARKEIFSARFRLTDLDFTFYGDLSCYLVAGGSGTALCSAASSHLPFRLM
jgi:hypothetical protein